jgi:DNA primase
VIALETLDRVKRDVNVVEVIGESVKLTKRGKSYVGLCPFHKEKTPSFHVNPERGFYHCFGCHASGDAIKFLKETEGLDFVEAIRRLAERMGIEVVETASDAERREQTEARRRLTELYEIGNQAAVWFERMLREHPLRDFAEQELARRELVAKSPTDTVADALQAFRVGYAPISWDGLSSHLRDAGLSVAAAEKVGLVLPRRSGSGYYDRFRHRLMFAVLDVQGRVIAFSGRALDEPSAERLRALGIEPKTGEPPAKYMNSPESPVYRKREAVFGLHQARQAIRARDRAILVEGNFDVLSLHARNLKNVVAPLGTAFTVEQARSLRRLSANVTLLFDSDGAGRRAVHQAHEACREAGLTARVATLPPGTDPDEFSRREGSERLERVIDAAEPIVFYLIGELLDERFAKNDSATQAGTVREIIRVIGELEDPNQRDLTQALAADRLAGRLGLGHADGRTLQQLLGRLSASVARPHGPGKAPAGVAPPHRARSRDRRSDIELEVLGVFLEFPELFDAADAPRAGASLEGITAVAHAALRQNHLAGVRDPEEVLAKLPAPIHPFALARWAAPKHERVVDAKAELILNLRKLESLEWSREKSLVVEELERAEKTGDFEQQAALLRRLHERTRRARERDGS